jgi:hypothetical protein
MVGISASSVGFILHAEITGERIKALKKQEQKREYVS